MNLSDQTITDLITSFLCDRITPEEYRILQDWIAGSDDHRRYFEEMKIIWQVSGTVDRPSSFDTGKAWSRVSSQQEVRTYSSRRKVSMNIVKPGTAYLIRRTLQVAALIALIFMGGGITCYYVFRPQIEGTKELAILENQEYRIMVPRGAKSVVMLPDGSRVSINAGSKLVYSTSYGVSSREVTLEGEAYFDVSTNPEKPFTIHTSDLAIKAFGTAFNVKAYPEDPVIVTTLEHGNLQVESKNNDGFDIVLQPRQNVVYYKTKPDVKVRTGKQSSPVPAVAPASISIMDDVNTGLYTSWKDPEWIIESQTFGDLSVSLERRYNVRIVFDSDALKSYRFSGTIRNETIEQVLKILAITAPMKYTIDQGIVQLQIDNKRKPNYDVLSK